MASPSDRRIIWWLCLKNTDCYQCYKRLNPLPTEEDIRNATIRKVKDSRRIA